MRLIRMTTENEEGVFDNEFSAIIKLEPDSKIALANVSLEAQQNEIIIDSENDAIQIQYSTGNVVDIKLKHGTFTHANYTDLLDDITKNLNTYLGNSPKDSGSQLGIQWKVQVGNPSAKIEVGYLRSNLAEYKDEWVTNKVARVASGTNDGIWASTENDYVGTNDRVMYMDEELCKGGSAFRCKLHTLLNSGGADIVEQGIIIGLTSKKPSTLTPINDSEIVWGIHAKKHNIAYSAFVNGQYRTSGDPSINTVILYYNTPGDVNNDIMSISLNQGYIQLKIYKDGGSVDGDVLYQLKLLPFQQMTSYYPFIAFRGKDTNAKCRLVRATLDPYLKTQEENVGDDEVGANNAPQQQKGATNQYILYGGISLANFLGFNNQRTPINGFDNVSIAKYVADKIFQITSIGDSFLVELLNIDVSSYDGLSRQRRNILAVIPETDNISPLGQVIYEANNLIFLDIGNAYPISIRNIRARLLRSDLSPLPTQGLSTMTILIKGATE